VDDVYAVVREMARITKKYLIIIVPWDRPTHCYPMDCWRISPTGLRFLIEKLINFHTLECEFIGRDSYIIAKKIYE
jgi:hypothetical protein